MSDSQPLPHDVRQLLAIRLGLEEALHRTRTAGPYRRGAAIVALDAVVERAVALAASARGIAISLKVDDMISRLRNDQSLKWAPTVLPDIRSLRKARNAAQHDGLEPDRDALPGWANAAEVFVVGLLEAQFAMDVRTVALADAISDDEIRRLFVLADQAYEAENLGACIDHLVDAYEAALTRWRRLRPSRPGFVRHDALDKSAHESIAHLQSALDAAAFVGDVGEAEWFSALRRDRGSDVFDDEDVSRARAFVFAWVTGYESATVTWVQDRRRRAAIKARRERTTEGPSFIASADVTEMYSTQLATTFVVANVPPPDQYDDWARGLERMLPTVEDISWSVYQDGTVRVSRPLATAGAAGQDVEALAAALMAVEHLVESQLEASRREAELQRRSADVRTADAAKIRNDWPNWITDVRGGQDNLHGADWEIELAPAAWGLRLLEGDGPAAQTSDIASAIRGADGVAQCWYTGSANILAIQPALPADELVEILRATDQLVSKAMASQDTARDARAQIIANARSAVAAELARVHTSA
ncbi:hypothetical protein [Microbacterium rhizosphaerae]|uniref:DUF4145 domain-containing protein n=1 Tax=Microbacterium rhizosphaerae TaxID=1678237 RepID=A0ABZ0SLH3_9MICO|nr:hypothetical protein [Microbacterium rhizosphaerae]WPR90251.1 hypothetical protein SM116_02905 [Microbacterium rhizosphaerae]